MQQKLRVVFHCEKDGQKIECEGETGELLTQVAYRAGVTIQQTCGGTPSCTDCRIKVLKEEADAFEPMEGAEGRLIGNVYFITKERLACQAVLKNSCEVFVPTPPARKEKVLKKSPNPARVPSSQNPTPGGGKFYGKQEETNHQKETRGQEKGRQENRKKDFKKSH